MDLSDPRFSKLFDGAPEFSLDPTNPKFALHTSSFFFLFGILRCSLVHLVLFSRGQGGVGGICICEIMLLWRSIPFVACVILSFKKTKGTLEIQEEIKRRKKSHAAASTATAPGNAHDRTSARPASRAAGSSLQLLADTVCLRFPCSFFFVSSIYWWSGQPLFANLPAVQ